MYIFCWLSSQMDYVLSVSEGTSGRDRRGFLTGIVVVNFRVKKRNWQKLILEYSISDRSLEINETYINVQN